MATATKWRGLVSPSRFLPPSNLPSPASSGTAEAKGTQDRDLVEAVERVSLNLGASMERCRMLEQKNALMQLKLVSA